MSFNLDNLMAQITIGEAVDFQAMTIAPASGVVRPSLYAPDDCDLMIVQAYNVDCWVRFDGGTPASNDGSILWRMSASAPNERIIRGDLSKFGALSSGDTGYLFAHFY